MSFQIRFTREAKDDLTRLFQFLAERDLAPRVFPYPIVIDLPRRFFLSLSFVSMNLLGAGGAITLLK